MLTSGDGYLLYCFRGLQGDRRWEATVKHARRQLLQQDRDCLSVNAALLETTMAAQCEYCCILITVVSVKRTCRMVKTHSKQ
jgi:hypothetical protein